MECRQTSSRDQGEQADQRQADKSQGRYKQEGIRQIKHEVHFGGKQAENKAVTASLWMMINQQSFQDSAELFKKNGSLSFLMTWLQSQLLSRTPILHLLPGRNWREVDLRLLVVCSFTGSLTSALRDLCGQRNLAGVLQWLQVKGDATGVQGFPDISSLLAHWEQSPYLVVAAGS